MPADVLALVFGGAIGFALGLLGGGGSILTVPILVYVLGQDVHSATGASLAIVGATAALATLLHARRREVRLRAGLLFGGTSMIGALPGVWLNHLLPGRLILLAFVALMIVVAALMLGKRTGDSEATAITSCDFFTWREWLRLTLSGVLVGLLTGFFGVGGGFLIVPALVLAGHFPAHQAVGTSLLIIAMASLSGFLGHLQLGGLDLSVVGPFVAGGLIGSLGGTALCGRLPAARLAKGFGVFILLVALYTGYHTLVV